MKMMRMNVVAGTLLALALTACQKPTAQSEDEPATTPRPAVATAAAPTPAVPSASPGVSVVKTSPATPPPASVARELAPPGVFYLVEAARIETDSGVIGLAPGTGVKRLHDDVYLTPSGEVHLRASQLTNDLTVARQALHADRATQAAAQARIAADSAAIAARAKAAATAMPAPDTSVSASTSEAPPPSATPSQLGSSLSRPQDALNTTHTSTKDKVYTDNIGRYWKDTQGHRHYF